MSSTGLTGGFAFQSPSPYYKSGWLTKQGHLVKNWKRRWFMLSKTHIAYAEDQTMRTIKGTIALEDGATITTRVPREQLDLKYPFMFLLKPSKTAKTIFLLASDSLEDMLAWTAAFHRNIVQIPVWRSEQVSGSVPAAAKGKVADTLVLAGDKTKRGSSRSAPTNALSDSAAMLLPDTLLLRVFTYLGEIELSRVCFVCSRWRTVAEEDTLWQGLVARTYRFYRANVKQQRWKNFYRDTPAILPRPSAAGLAKATNLLFGEPQICWNLIPFDLSEHILRPEALNSMFSGSDTDNRRGVFLLARNTDIPEKCTAFACAIRSPEHQAFLLGQSYILNISAHPNLVRPVHCYIEKSFIWAACEGEMHVSLASIVESANGPLPEEIIAAISCELLKAVSFLHTLGYISGSVRSENVSFYMPNQVKLGAYAVTHTLLSQSERIADFVSLTHWTPPEVYAKKSATKAVDIWQVGITALEMALLSPPYGQYPAERALQWLIEKGPPPLAGKQWSNEFKEWLSLCLAVDPAQRGSFTALLMHNFIAGKAASPAKMQAFLGQERRDFFSNLLS